MSENLLRYRQAGHQVDGSFWLMKNFYISLIAARPIKMEEGKTKKKENKKKKLKRIASSVWKKHIQYINRKIRKKDQEIIGPYEKKEIETLKISIKCMTKHIRK